MWSKVLILFRLVRRPRLTVAYVLYLPEMAAEEIHTVVLIWYLDVDLKTIQEACHPFNLTGMLRAPISTASYAPNAVICMLRSNSAALLARAAGLLLAYVDRDGFGEILVKVLRFFLCESVPSDDCILWLANSRCKGVLGVTYPRRLAPRSLLPWRSSQSTGCHLSPDRRPLPVSS